jgi:hypothetical protein
MFMALGQHFVIITLKNNCSSFICISQRGEGACAEAIYI